MTDEVELLAEADRRARTYTASIGDRRVFPSAEALGGLAAFNEPFPEHGLNDTSTLALLDDAGSPATVASNDPRYFGFVTGASLPVAAAADRLVLAWDQGALAHITSPVAATVERRAADWLLEVLDLPRESTVGFTTSATAGTVVALATARRAVLARQGWDVDRRGLAGAPEVRVVVSELIHVVVTKALRVLGFGLDNLVIAPVDSRGRVDPARLPPLDERTILLLQAGEVNTGEFDPFATVIPVAKGAGAWVHVDGAFGLWARASKLRALTDGVEGADSWTTDGHKWLNTPYDSAMVIVRDGAALAETMNSDAVYSTTSVDSQKNLTLEFSRRARGISVWAALRTLGRDGVSELVERTSSLASRAAAGLREQGFEVLNEVVINQVLARAGDADTTRKVVSAAQASGETWFGPTVWHGEPAFRISVSSWRTTEQHIDALLAIIRSASA